MWIQKCLDELVLSKINSYPELFYEEQKIREKFDNANEIISMADSMCMDTGRPYLDCLRECANKNVKHYIDGTWRTNHEK